MKTNKWRTTSTEDFLKIVYRLESKDGMATTVDIAKALSIAPSSATDVIKRMAKEKPALISYAPYRGTKLTAHGQKFALEIIRKHRLIELMLLKVFDYNLDEVHDDAERLEHSASKLFIEKIAKKLGNPSVDPHGEPIPRE